MAKLKIGNNEMECAFFGLASAGNVQIIITDKSMAEMAMIFTSPDVEHMYLEEAGTTKLYQGYTVLNTIAAMDEGVRVSLRRKFIGE